jgi:hypothetical protein
LVAAAATVAAAALDHAVASSSGFFKLVGYKAMPQLVRRCSNDCNVDLAAAAATTQQ